MSERQPGFPNEFVKRVAELHSVEVDRQPAPVHVPTWQELLQDARDTLCNIDRTGDAEYAAGLIARIDEFLKAAVTPPEGLK